MFIIKKITRYISSILIMSIGFISCIFPMNVHAQYFADIVMELSPSFPKVGELVTVSVVSSDVNLDFQNITWYINGERGLSGIAQTSVIFEVEANVPNYQVRAVIGQSPGQVVREISFAPGEVIMLWEAVDSYVPKWYKGKALMPAEGTVRVTAVPVGAPSLDKLFFVWKQGYNGLASQSGYGKNSIVLTNTVFLNTLDIEVEISSADKSYLSKGQLRIPRADADVRLASISPGRTPLFEKSGILSVFGRDANIVAIPYNMPSRRGTAGLVFNWLLNGVAYSHESGEDQSMLFIENPNVPIVSEIQVQSYEHLLQEAGAQKQIIFK